MMWHWNTKGRKGEKTKGATVEVAPAIPRVSNLKELWAGLILAPVPGIIRT